MKHCAKEMNHFLWTGNSTLNKKTFEMNIDCQIQCTTLVDSRLIRRDPFIISLQIHIFHRHCKSKDVIFFQKNSYRKIQTYKWTN